MVDFDQVKNLWHNHPTPTPFGTLSIFASPKPVITPIKRVAPKSYLKSLTKKNKKMVVSKPKSSPKTSSMLMAIKDRKMVRLFPTRTIMTRSMATTAGLVF